MLVVIWKVDPAYINLIGLFANRGKPQPESPLFSLSRNLFRIARDPGSIREGALNRLRQRIFLRSVWQGHLHVAGQPLPPEGCERGRNLALLDGRSFWHRFPLSLVRIQAWGTSRCRGLRELNPA
jgi:hypothetical protein